MQELTGIGRPSEADTSEVQEGSDTVTYSHSEEAPSQPKTSSTLKAPTLRQLLETTFSDRQHLLFPWLREQESCMVYAATGVGKSMFALSAALAIAGDGEFLGWKPTNARTALGGVCFTSMVKCTSRTLKSARGCSCTRFLRVTERRLARTFASSLDNIRSLTPTFR